MSNRHCAWCKTVMGHKDGLDDGEITHGICNPCKNAIIAEVAGFTVPYVDEALLVDCTMMTDGTNIHGLNNIINAYINSAEAFQVVFELSDVLEQYEIWIECYRKITDIRKAGRRARLDKNATTRKYVR